MGADNLAGRVVAGRYRLDRLLGAGGMGAVYEAEQLSLGRRVAVKVVKAERAGEDDVARRFSDEIRVVTRLVHPNIVTVYDGGRADDGLLFLAMELLPGESLRARLDRTGPLSLENALAIAEDAASALLVAHEAGILHRDLKPENLMLAPTAGHRERAKLLDFGVALVAVDEAERNTGTGFVAGTPGYIAPEQMLGQTVDARSDLYALGVVLFEMLAGAPPFSGKTGIEVMMQHATTQAPRVSTRATVPADVDDLVAQLLAKTPAERPASARALLERVRALRSSYAEVSTPQARITATESDVRIVVPSSFTPIAGRALELAALDGALAETQQGRGSLWALVGDAGIGKTRLADAFAERAHAAGVDVFWGRAWEGALDDGGGASGAPAFHPWTQALDALVAAHPAAVDAADAPVLAALVRSLRGDHASDAVDRARLFTAVDDLLRRAARAKPIAIVLDDVHAADEASLRLLRAVTRDVRQRRVIVVATLRDDPRDVTAALLREARVLPVGPLAKDAVAALVAARVGPRADAALVDRVYEASQGVPLAVDEVVRAVVARGASADAAPIAAADVVKRRLARLAAADRDVLAAAAVLGGDARTAWVSSVAGVPADNAVRAGIKAGVLVDAGDVVRFAHASLRDEIVGSLPPDKRRALHVAAARMLAKKSAASKADVAQHLLHAGPEHAADAAHAAIAASDELLARFAFEDAVRLLERARDAAEDLEPPDEALQGRLVCALGRTKMNGGDVDEGRRLCVEAAMAGQRLGDFELVADAALAYGSRQLEGLLDANLIELLQGALAALPPSSRVKRALVQARLAAALQPHEDPAIPLAMAREAAGEARAIGDRPSMLPILFDASSALFGAAHADERKKLDEECIRLAEAFGDWRRAQRSRLRLVYDHCELGDSATAARTLEAWIHHANRLAQPERTWRVPLLRAMLAEMDGRDEDAHHDLDIVATSTEPSAQAQLGLHSACRAVVLDDVRALSVPHVEAASRLMADRQGDNAFHWFRAMAASVRDDAAECRRSLDRVPATAWQWKMRDTSAIAGLIAAKHGFVDLGQRVRAVVESGRGMLVSYGSVAGYVGPPYDFVVGMLDLLDGNLDAARASFAAARAVAAKSTAPGIRTLLDARLAALPANARP